MIKYKVGDRVELYPDQPRRRDGRPQYGIITFFPCAGMCCIDLDEYGWMSFRDISLAHRPFKVEDWNID